MSGAAKSAQHYSEIGGVVACPKACGLIQDLFVIADQHMADDVRPSVDAFERCQLV